MTAEVSKEIWRSNERLTCFPVTSVVNGNTPFVESHAQVSSSRYNLPWTSHSSKVSALSIPMFFTVLANIGGDLLRILREALYLLRNNVANNVNQGGKD